MRTFLAKNGMLNHVLIGVRADRAAAGAEPARLARHRHRLRLEAGAVRDAAARRRDGVAGDGSTSRRRATSARARLRVLVDIVLPQVRGTLLVGLVLSFVTMLSVLSVPMMINPNSPTMITVDIAYRISTHGDYAVANALCLMSLVVAAARRVVLPAARGRAAQSTTLTSRLAHRGAGDMAADASASAIAARAARVRDLRAARQPVPVGVRREVVLPEQAAAGVRPHVLGARVQPRGGALASLGTSVWIALLTVVVSLAVAIPAGYALARLKLRWRGLILLAFLLPQAMPEPARLREHRARVLRDRA